MYVRIDTRRNPPGVQVSDPEDLTGLEVVLVGFTRSSVISYAERNGWVDGEGRIRAHVELTAEGGDQPGTF